MVTRSEFDHQALFEGTHSILIDFNKFVEKLDFERLFDGAEDEQEEHLFDDFAHEESQEKYRGEVGGKRESKVFLDEQIDEEELQVGFLEHQGAE